MSHSHRSDSHLPFLPSLSAADRATLDRALTTRAKRRQRDAEARAAHAEQLVEDVERRLRNLVGARAHTQFQADLQRERLALRDALQPPAGLTRDRAKLRAKGRRAVDGLIRRLGTSRAKVRAVLDRAAAKLEAATETKAQAAGYHLGRHRRRWDALSPLHRFPLPWGERIPDLGLDPNDPHRWFLYQPPFFGFLFHEDIVTTGDFRAHRTMKLHPPSGLVGNQCTMDLDDAGNWNLASVVGESQIAVAFTPPVTGVIEVLVDAQCTIDGHAIHIEDEFGFSDAWCDHTSALMVDVLHPNVPTPTVAAMAHTRLESDGDDTSQVVNILTGGQHYFAQLFATGPVQAGQTVIVTAGAQSTDVTYSNDMELHSYSDCQWFISSLEIRIAP
ncbi:MAG: hypothetical protein U0P30_10590 [Vicinamibacterales bacterium]